MYATRRIKDAFRENKDVTDPEKLMSLIKKAQDSLEIMKRQVRSVTSCEVGPRVKAEDLPVKVLEF